MLLYGIVIVDSEMDDPRDRTWIYWHHTEEEQEAHLRRLCIESGMPYDRAGMVHQGERYMWPITGTVSLEDEPCPTGSVLERHRCMDTNSLDTQMVWQLRKAALQAGKEQGGHVNQVLRCMATMIDGYLRGGRADSVELVKEMASYMSLHHRSAPYRRAFAAAVSKLNECVAKYNKGCRLDGDPLYGKGGERS